MNRLLNRIASLGVLVTIVLLVLVAPASAATDAAQANPLLDTASWALLSGFLTPLVTSVIQQPQWSKRSRSIVAVVVSIIVGVVTLLANGAFNDGPQTVLSVLVLVVVTSGATYRTLWRPVGVAGAVEGATSPSRASSS